MAEELAVETIARADGVKLEGECKWFHFTKGFGFLQNITDGGNDVYVHHSDIKGFACLVPNQKVEFVFKAVSGKKNESAGGRATSVTAVGGGDIRNHGSLRSTAMSKKLEENTEIILGHIKWLDPTKGYGFITPVDGSEDVFVHNKALLLARPLDVKLPEGMDVEYQIGKPEEGDGENTKLRATNVTAPGGVAINPHGPVTQPLPYMQEQPVAASVLGKRPAHQALEAFGYAPVARPGFGGGLLGTRGAGMPPGGGFPAHGGFQAPPAHPAFQPYGGGLLGQAQGGYPAPGQFQYPQYQQQQRRF